VDLSSVNSLLELVASTTISAASSGVIEALHLDSTDRLLTVVKGSQKVTLVPSYRYHELCPKKDLRLLFASQVCLPFDFNVSA
jgi:hypothetical protein